MKRPGNLRGIQTSIPRAFKSVRRIPRFGYFGAVDAADTAKNSISTQLIDLEGRVSNWENGTANIDVQSLYLEAVTMQKNLQNYNTWSGSWGPIALGGFYSSDAINTRLQTIIDKTKILATTPQQSVATVSPTLVAKPIEQTVENVAATGSVTQVQAGTKVGILEKTDDQLADFFINNYPNATSIDTLSQLTDGEKARFQTAITIEGLLTLLTTTVDRFKGGAIKQGECVVNNHPDYLIPTIQEGITHIIPTSLEAFYNQKLADLTNQWKNLTPEQQTAGCEQIKQDIVVAVNKAKEENDRLGPCAIEREARSIKLAESSTIGYALSLDKFSNAMDDALMSFYGSFSFLPDSFKGCHPPRWPIYLVIGIVVTAATLVVFKGALKVVTFGALKKNRRKSRK